MADRVALIQKGSIPICGAPQDLKKAVGATEFIELEKRPLCRRGGSQHLPPRRRCASSWSATRSGCLLP